MKKLLSLSLLALALALGLAACGGDDSSDEATAADDGPVVVFPTPGDQFASPDTQISFLGASSEDLAEVEVTGARSGAHEGEILEHSNGEGASFVPEQPFEQGERVTVTSGLEIEGGENGEFQFATFRSGRATVPPGGLPPEPAGDNVNVGQQRDSAFRSAPDLKPPPVTVNVEGDEELAGEGYIFISPKFDGVMILDNKGELVWFKPGKVADFKVQEYQGEPVMTWWEGDFDTILAGFANGRFEIMNENYEIVESIQASNGYQGNLHEFVITPEGTALMTIYEPVRADLTAIDGPEDGVVMDSIIQEVDLETGAVLFEWHSLDHVGVENGMTPYTKGSSYDYFHINSVREDDDGNLIVSARNTSGIYKIDRETGELIWTLGGKNSDFELDQETTFTAQHDAHRTSEGYVSLFDNATYSPEPSEATREQSRGLILDLDEEAMTASVVREYEHDGYLSVTQGNMQELPNGNVMVGWGNTPGFSEFTKDGELVFDAGVTARNSSYRAHRFPWEGMPTTDPAIAIAQSGGRQAVFASWNGATQVDSWQVVSGADADSLEPVGDPAPRDGFETEIPVGGLDAVVAVEALDENGEVLGTSEAIPAGG